MHVFNSAALLAALDHWTVDSIKARKCAIQARNLEDEEKGEAWVWHLSYRKTARTFQSSSSPRPIKTIRTRMLQLGLGKSGGIAAGPAVSVTTGRRFNVKRRLASASPSLTTPSTAAFVSSSPMALLDKSAAREKKNENVLWFASNLALPMLNSVGDSLEDIGGGSDRLVQIGELGPENLLLLARQPFAPSL